MADWSLLPKDLLRLLAGRLETCFDLVHFRSVCTSWWTAVPPPGYLHLLGINSILPIFNDNPRFQGDEHCILKKIPVSLLRFQTPYGFDYLIIGMSEKKSGKQKLMWPLPNFGNTPHYGIVLNTLSSQIIPLGHYYKVKFYAIVEMNHFRTRRAGISKKVAFLELDNEDFAVVAGVLGDLMMYQSREKEWTEIQGGIRSYQDMVSFKGKFYVVDTSGQSFVIEPSSLEVTKILSHTRSRKCSEERLVESRDGQELLLVQRFTPGEYHQEYMHTWFRLFRLNGESEKRWDRIDDLEDRVVFLGSELNLCYSAQEIPSVKGNCVVFMDPDHGKISVFDLRTRRTSTGFTEFCSGYMGAFGENKESMLSCGIVTMLNPTISIYDLDSD